MLDIMMDYDFEKKSHFECELSLNQNKEVMNFIKNISGFKPSHAKLKNTRYVINWKMELNCPKDDYAFCNNETNVQAIF